MADLKKYEEINEQIEKSNDHGEAIINSLDLTSMMYITNMELVKLMKVVRESQENPKDDDLKAQIRLYDISVYNRSRALMAKILDADAIWMTYSKKTRRLYRVGDFAAVCLDEETSKKVAESIDKNGYDVEMRKIEGKENIFREMFEVLYYGFKGARVFCDNIFVDILLKVFTEFINVSKIKFPQNIKTRYSIINFSQELQKRNQEISKVRGEEYAMYDAMFKGVYLAVFYEENGNTTFPMVSRDKDAKVIFLPVYTDEPLLGTSSAFAIAKQKSEQVKYRQFTFDSLIEFLEGKEGISGFVIDAETINWVVERKNIEVIKKIKKLWDDNGGSFENKNQPQEPKPAAEDTMKQAACDELVKEREEASRQLKELQEEIKKYKFSLFGDAGKQKKALSDKASALEKRIGELDANIAKYRN
ncbi:MAG: hypothetical protein PUF72_08795 [Clostridiales bacterium]|nr:hypothetical protein [Clostridiales bacterium]